MCSLRSPSVGRAMEATSIITVLIVIVALSISGLISTVYYEPLDEDEEKVSP